MIAQKSEPGYTEYEIPGVGWVSPTGSGYTTTYTLTNQRGDTVGLAVGSTLTNIRDYDAYGGFYSLLANSDSDLRYVGGKGVIWNNESQTFTMGLREYSPYLGRFLDQDPIGYSGGLNLYAYCGNEPVMKSDPTGTSGSMIINLLVSQNKFENNSAGRLYRSAENQLYKHWWRVHRSGDKLPGSNFLPIDVRRPHSPASYDFADSIATAQALRVLTDSSSGYLFKLAWFLSQVSPYGPMDFAHDKGVSSSQHMNNVDFGNYNSGMIGMALGLEPETLLNSSGVTAKFFRESDRNGSWYGDQPRDSFFVQLGIHDYQESHKN